MVAFATSTSLTPTRSLSGPCSVCSRPVRRFGVVACAEEKKDASAAPAGDEVQAEKSKPKTKGMPLQQGRVPVQSGAQADKLAVKSKRAQAEEEKPMKKDEIKEAEEEIKQLSELPELTEEQQIRIKRMKKRVTRAAAIQESQGFADAWSQRNAGRLDVWFWIGLVFLLTPPAILVWGVTSGLIPLE
mmetsp:Transcript_7275/g.22160  ORF Transcript_7275/g.22160 Transcript_7275/m.22160 type:complete len:187 (+) Transcript_7275:48-608(+)